MSLDYSIEHIHGGAKISSKLAGVQERQINIRCKDYKDLKDTFRELLEFFSKAHGHSYDSDTIGEISYRALEVDGLNTHVHRFAWSYKVPKNSRWLTFYVNPDALKTFKFWYPKSTDQTWQ